MKNKELSETDNILEEVIKLNKQGIESYRQEQYEEAIKYYNEALEIVKTYKTSINNNDYAKIFYNKARAYEKINNLIMSIKFYEEAIKTDSTHVKAREYLDSSKKAIVKTPLIIKENEIEKIIISKETNIVKISCLKHLEEIYYKPLIKELAYKKTIEGIKDLVVVLNNLGFLTTKLGDLSDNLKYYTDAAVFYQHALTIIEEKLKTVIDEKIYKEETEKLYIKLNEIKENIISAASNSTEEIINVGEETLKNKQTLANLRKDAKEKITTIEEYNKKDNIKYINLATELFQDIAQKMKEFLAELYKESEQEIGKPPCEYTVIGLGSMALQQMTPYSDLEFAILTKNDNYRDSSDPKVKEYFKSLTHLVNFKIINLGETSIPFSKYNLDLDHLIRVAVNFDLGGKTPLGRIENDKPYELIQTVERMLWYMCNKEDKTSHIDKNLPYILEKVCYVYGNKELITQYQEQVKNYLFKETDNESNLNCEARALKVLKEGSVEFNYLETLNKPTALKSKGNIEALKPELLETAGKLFNVKQDIYRLPDRYIYSWGLHYGVDGDNAWDIIDKLKAQEIIKTEAADNLKYAVTFATTLRLKTYLHNNAQKEYMSIFSNEKNIIEQFEKIFRLSKEDLEEDGSLFQYFYITLPLHEKLQEFCDRYKELNKEDRTSFFKASKFYIADSANKGFIYYRLLQYKEAQTNLEYAVESLNSSDLVNDKLKPNFLQIRNILGSIYNEFGLEEKAIEQFQYCLNFYKTIYKDQPHQGIAISLNNLGVAFENLGHHKDAIKCHTQSLNIYKIIFKDQTHPKIAVSLNNLGNVYSTISKTKEAIEYYTQSLDIYKIIHKGQANSDIAVSLNNLGNAYYNIYKYDDAISYFTQGLNTYKVIYKDEPHPGIAVSLNNLGNAYNFKGNCNKAIEYYSQAIEIYEIIYKNQPHQCTADSLNNLGIVYSKIHNYDKAIKCYSQSIKLYKAIYKDKSHSDIAVALNNLGQAYNSISDYKKAAQYCTESLDIRKTLYNDKPHPDIADSLSTLGSIHYNMCKYDESIDYLTRSLNIYKSVYGEKPYLCIAISLNNLGAALEAIGKQKEAEKYYAKSDIIQKILYKEESDKKQKEEINQDIFDFQKNILFYESNSENSNMNLTGDILDDEM